MDQRIGGLEDWRIGGLEDWRIGALTLGNAIFVSNTATNESNDWHGNWILRNAARKFLATRTCSSVSPPCTSTYRSHRKLID